MRKFLLAIFALFSVCAVAQVSVQPILQPHVTFVNSTGTACAGCSLYTYAAGTTTPLATYTDSTGTSQNTNPIILDASGGATIWPALQAYKYVLKDTTGATLWTVDNVSSGTGLVEAAAQYCFYGQTQTGTQAIANCVPGISWGTGGSLSASTLTASVNKVLNVVSYGAKCDGSTDDTTAIQNAVTAANGGAVYFPQGTCLFSGLTIPAPGSIWLQGAGKMATILKYTGSGTAIISSAPSATTDAAMLRPRMSDLQILSAASGTGIGLDLSGMEHGDIEDVRFVGFQKPVVAVTAVGYASYGNTLDDDDFLQSIPSCCSAIIQYPAITLGPGNDGTGGLNTGHFTIIHPLIEGYAVALEENYASNVTFQDADVEYSCQAVYVPYATASFFINDYLDSNQSSANCSGWGTYGVRYQINGGDGNYINPLTHNGGTGTNSIAALTTTVIDPQVGNNFLQGNIGLTGNLQLNNTESLCAFTTGAVCVKAVTETNLNALVFGDSTNLPPVYLYGSSFNFNNYLSVGNLASDPASPLSGSVWYNTTSKLLKGEVNGAAVPLATGIVEQWANQTLCTPATSTDAACTGTFTFPSSFSFADTNYGLSITAESTGGAFVFATVTGKTTTTASYAVTCTFNCGTYGTLTFDILGWHP